MMMRVVKTVKTCVAVSRFISWLDLLYWLNYLDRTSWIDKLDWLNLLV